MSEKKRRTLNSTKTIPKPNAYINALTGEFSTHAFDEERAPHNKSIWRKNIFKVTEDHPLDLEIGTGNGYHFAYYAKENPKRCLLGLEVKYKPLIQTIRRALANGSRNACVARYLAQNIDELFAEGELNNVIVHFPDPWVTPRKPKNRIFCADFLNGLSKLQRSSSLVEFKTDSREYFDWALPQIQDTPYEIVFCTYDLHQSEKAATNFITSFERIFMNNGICINYLLLRKKDT